jgi:hypothetical protein
MNWRPVSVLDCLVGTVGGLLLGTCLASAAAAAALMWP